MKRFLALLFCLVVVSSLVTGPSASALSDPPHVRNAGFESGTAGWTTSGGTVRSTGARSGSRVAELTGGQARFEQKINDLLPNTTYTLSGWVRTDSGEAVIGVKGSYGGPERSVKITSTDFTRGAVTFTTGPLRDHHEAVIYFAKDSAANTAYGDDFEVVRSEPRPDERAVNGSFEDGADGWERDDSTVVGHDARTGVNAGRLTGGASALQQTVTGLSPNTTYRLSGYVKTDSQQARIGVKAYGGAETSVKLTAPVYTRGAVTFRTGPTNSSAVIQFFKTSAGNTAYGDDFSVARVATTPATVWTEGSLASVFRDSLPTQRSGDSIDLVAARNEYEFGQIALRAAGTFDISEVKLSDLRQGPHRIPAANLRYRFIDHIRLGHNSDHTADPIRPAPGYFPEYLVNDRTRSVPGNTTQPISVTVFVPPGTAPGKYTGAVQVRTSAGNHTIPVNIEVADVTIPEPKDSALTYANYTQLFGFEGTADQVPLFYPGMEKYSPAWTSLMKKFAADMKEHRINGQWIPTLDLLDDAPGTAVAADGKITFDWTRFDEVVQLLIDAGAVKTLIGDNFLLKLPGETYGIWSLKRTADGQTVKQTLPYDSAEAQSFARQYLPALKAHLAEKGWLSRWYQTVADEPGAHPNWNFLPIWRRAYDELLDVHLKGVKTTTPHFTFPKDSAEIFKGRLDVYIPQLDIYANNTAYYQDRKSKGDELWTYICVEPKLGYYNRFIDMPLSRLRFMNWYNFAQGATGTLHWAYSNWKEPVAHWWTPGDTSIVYPDAVHNDVISTLRNDTMRDGAEEYELLAILAKTNAPLARKLATAVAPTATDASRDDEYLAGKHDELVRAAAGRPGAGPTRKAYDILEAESFDQVSGIFRENTTDLGGGQNIGGAGDGDELSYSRIDFGAGGSARLDLRVSSIAADGAIEVRLDDPAGPLLGTVPIPNTGGWQNWRTARIPVTVPAGAHSVHLKFTGLPAVANVNWFKFTRLDGNLASEATATASSAYSADYGAALVKDAITNEWQHGEWASAGEQNPWVRLDWTTARTVRKIVLFDRNNPFDDANSGVLSFSDGTSVPVTGIPADGDGLTVEVPARAVTWVKFQVTGGQGFNVGLSEIEVS